MSARIINVLFLVTLLLSLSVVAAAQDDDALPGSGDQPMRRPNLFRELGLTQEQRDAIRKYNEENRPAIQEAQRRVREANRELDQAIYSEKVEDSVVEEKLKAFQGAQAEASRLRFNSELALRKILTSEQLVKFVAIRRRFAEARQEMQQRRREDRPMRRLDRQGQQRPPGI
ncbi:MAG: periplasmic heavy metal sensor [Pyrinomonadaceae bacterium]|nr:periplasmic heavy metal sensor [Pyrinomonadaceae bacterium]